MRTIGNTLFILAAATTIAAIWSPIGAWWQWLASAILLFLAGAYAYGTTLGHDDTPTSAEAHPAEDHPTGNATGPHLHHDTTGATHTNPHNNYGTPA